MIRVLPFALAILSASAASAETLAFDGALTNDTPPPGPSPLCSVGEVRVAFSPADSAQTSSSNFGGFGFTQSHCVAPGAPSYAGGVFSFAFAGGDAISGTYSGFFTPTDVAGVLNSTVNFVVTDGTGRFEDAVGRIQGLGVLDRTVPRPFNSLRLTGVLDVAGAVPEPASWATMISGFALAGSALRRRAGAPGGRLIRAGAG